MSPPVPGQPGKFKVGRVTDTSIELTWEPAYTKEGIVNYELLYKPVKFGSLVRTSHCLSVIFFKEMTRMQIRQEFGFFFCPHLLFFLSFSRRSNPPLYFLSLSLSQEKLTFGPRNSYTVEGLKANTEYSFSLAAISSKGIGAFTNELVQRTSQASMSPFYWAHTHPHTHTHVCLNVCSVMFKSRAHNRNANILSSRQLVAHSPRENNLGTILASISFINPSVRHPLPSIYVWLWLACAQPLAFLQPPFPTPLPTRRQMEMEHRWMFRSSFSLPSSRLFFPPSLYQCLMSLSRPKYLPLNRASGQRAALTPLSPLWCDRWVRGQSPFCPGFFPLSPFFSVFQLESSGRNEPSGCFCAREKKKKAKNEEKIAQGKEFWEKKKV